jgi:WD40 repeat protein/serine/threonine protein kinase
VGGSGHRDYNGSCRAQRFGKGATFQRSHIRERLMTSESNDEPTEKEEVSDGRSPAAGPESLARTVGRSDLHTPNSSAGPVLDRIAARTPEGSRYELRGEVARGGMGAILRAWDPDLRRILAMKVALGGAARDRSSGESTLDDKLLSRFLEEAQVTAQLDHPGVVPVHELGLDNEGKVFFTMRLVEGQDLGQVFDGYFEATANAADPAAGESDQWTLTRLVDVLLKVSEAMAYAHTKNVIHRDLKPANIMVGRFGEVYVMDWGLARVLGKTSSKSTRRESSIDTDRRDASAMASTPALMTLDGDLIGTPAFMSPEQAAGKHEEVGRASDIYCLGSILYHLLGRRMPYCLPGERRNAGEVWSDLRGGPPADLLEIASSAPDELVAICKMAMAREVSDRYASMRDFGEDLRAYLEGRVVKAHRTGPWIETRKWIERNRALAITAAIAVMALAGGLGGTAAVQVRAGKRLEAQNEELTISRNNFEAASDRLEIKNEELTISNNEADWQRALVRSEQDKLKESMGETERALAESRRVAYVGAVTAAALNLQAGELGEVRRQLDTCPDDLRGWEWGHYRLSLDTSLQVYGDELGAYQAIFSKDQRLVHALCVGGEIRTWDAFSGELVGSIESAGDLVLACDPMGERLLTGKGNGKLFLWDLDSNELERSFQAHAKAVFYAGFIDGGTKLLSVGEDDQILVWDAVTADVIASTTLQVMPQGMNQITGICLDEEAGLLYVSKWSGAVQTILLDPLQSLGSMSAGGLVSVMAFDGKSGRLATASPSGLIQIFDREQDVPALAIRANTYMIRMLAFSPDGLRIIGHAEDSPILSWDARDGRLLGPIGRTGGALSSIGFRGDGQRLLLAERQRAEELPEGSRMGVQLWGAETAGFSVPFAEHESPLRRIAFLGRGERMATLAIGATEVRLWDGEAGDPLGAGFSHERPILDFRVSADGSRVATAGRSGEVRLWEPNTDTMLAEIELGRERPVAIALSPLGSELAIAGSDGTLRLFDGTLGSVLLDNITDGETIRAIEFHPDGQRLVYSDNAGALHDWHLNQSTSEAVGYSERPVSAIAFSPDGTRMLTSAMSHVVQVMDTQSWEVIHRLDGHTDVVNSVCFSPASDRIFTATADGIVWVWDAVGYRRLAKLEGHEGGIVGISVRPDGGRILTASLDHFVRTWDSQPSDARAMWNGEARRKEARTLLSKLYIKDPEGQDLRHELDAQDHVAIDVRECAWELETMQSSDQRIRMRIEAAWDVIWRTDSRPDDYVGARRALQVAYDSESRGVTRKGYAGVVRGLALYRTRDFAGALDTLTSAARRLRSAWPSGRLPNRTEMRLVDELGIAMCLWQLDQKDEAREQLSQAVLSAGDGGLAVMSIWQEAHALIRS